MSLEQAIEDIRHHADEAKAVAEKNGFEQPQSIVEALNRVADALELLAQK